MGVGLNTGLLDGRGDGALVGQHELLVHVARDESGAREGGGYEHGVHASLRLAGCQIRCALGKARQNRLALVRVLQQRHQSVLVTQPLHQLREWREDFRVHAELVTHLSHNTINDVEDVLGEELLCGLEIVVEGILQPSEGVRVLVVERVRIEVIQGWLGTLDVHRKIVARAVAHASILVADDLRGRRLLDVVHVVPHIRRAPRKVDEDPVEAVLPRQLDEAVGDDLVAEPVLGGINAEPDEVVPHAELAHHRHAIGHAQVHRGHDSLLGGHRIRSLSPIWPHASSRAFLSPPANRCEGERAPRGEHSPHIASHWENQA